MIPLIVKAASSGNWIPNSCLAMIAIPSRRKDVNGLYRVLGLKPDASDSEIRHAAKKLMLQYHPDTGGDRKRFEKVMLAYKTLGNPSSKAVYDSLERQSVTNRNGKIRGGGELTIEKIIADTGKKECSEPPAYWKGARDILNDDDVALVYEWLDMLMDVARDFHQNIMIKAGITYHLSQDYAIINDVAIIRAKQRPKRVMAEVYVLAMITKGENVCLTLAQSN